MAISTRFALDTTAVLGGGFLAVSAMTFTPDTAGWLGFGVSAAFALAGILGTVFARRTHQRLAHGALAVIGTWSLIADLLAGDTTQTWFVFADALALAAVALTDLVAHEATTERVVHHLDATAPHTAVPATPATALDNRDRLAA